MESSIGERLTAIRKKHNLTQQQIADAIGMTKRNYQRYEAGDTVPSYSVIYTLATYFDISVEDLLGGEKYLGGLRLRATRTDEKLTQEEAAKALGIKVSDLEKYESGEKSPSLKRLIKISEYFGVNRHFIAGIENESRHGVLWLSFSGKLKHYRLKKDLTQKQVAEHLNVPESLYRDYEDENGQAELDIGTISKLSDVLGITMDYLLNLTDMPHKEIGETYRGVNMLHGVFHVFILFLERMQESGEDRLKKVFAKRVYDIYCRLVLIMTETNDDVVGIKDVESVFIDSLADGTYNEYRKNNRELYESVSQFARHERKSEDKKICQEAAAILSNAIGILLSDTSDKT